MKKILAILCYCLMCGILQADPREEVIFLGSSTQTEELLDSLLPKPSSRPSLAQQEQIKRKYGMFIHFGINTFHNKEWTDGSKLAPPNNEAHVLL